MFTFPQHGGQNVAGRSVAQAEPHELRVDQSTAGPVGGELLDLFAACLVIVPLAFFLKAFLF